MVRVLLANIKKYTLYLKGEDSHLSVLNRHTTIWLTFEQDYYCLCEEHIQMHESRRKQANWEAQGLVDITWCGKGGNSGNGVPWTDLKYIFK